MKLAYAKYMLAAADALIAHGRDAQVCCLLCLGTVYPMHAADITRRMRAVSQGNLAGMPPSLSE